MPDRSFASAHSSGTSGATARSTKAWFRSTRELALEISFSQEQINLVEKMFAKLKNTSAAVASDKSRITLFLAAHLAHSRGDDPANAPRKIAQTHHVRTPRRI